LTGTVAMVPDEESYDTVWGSRFAFDLCRLTPSDPGVPIAECPRDLSDIIGVRVTFTGSLPACEVHLEFDHWLLFPSPYLLVISTDQPRDYLIEDARVWWDEALPYVEPSSVSAVRINIAPDVERAHAFDFCMRDVSIITR
jgi:hypothetical protein